MPIAYFETDEYQDFLSSLRHLSVCLKESQVDPFAWKWVTISLFSAVQGAMVCHLIGPQGTETMEKKYTEKYIIWLEDRPIKGDLHHFGERLADPGSLWKRLKGECRDYLPQGGVISASAELDSCFDYLKANRDSFIHFTPSTSIINIDRMRATVRAMLGLIDEIIKLGYAFRYLERESLDRQMSELRALASPTD